VRSVSRFARGLLNRRFGSALRFTPLTSLTLLTLAALHGDSMQPAALARRSRGYRGSYPISVKAGRSSGSIASILGGAEAESRQGGSNSGFRATGPDVRSSRAPLRGPYAVEPLRESAFPLEGSRLRGELAIEQSGGNCDERQSRIRGYLRARAGGGLGGRRGQCGPLTGAVRPFHPCGYSIHCRQSFGHEFVTTRVASSPRWQDAAGAGSLRSQASVPSGVSPESRWHLG